MKLIDLGVALAARVGRDLVHRARAVQRHECDEVLELGRLDLLQRLAHPLGLELEHPDRVAGGHHRVGLLVVERQRRHVRALAGRALDDVQRVLDHVEVAQAQEVHLEQADLLDRLHRVLRDRPVDLVAVLAHAGVGELQRHDVGQRAVGDHDRGRVDRRVADDPLETLRDVDDLLGGRVLGDLVGQLLAGREAVGEARRAPLLRVRDQLGQPVADRVLVAEDAGGVARRRAGEHLAEGDDLRHAVAAVLLGHVADHALPPAHREVDVDVGHGHALGVQEALEQQVVAERVDVGDRQAVRDDRAGRRATARADGDAVVLRVGDEVVDDQEVGVEAHRVDDAELHVGALLRRRGDRVAVAQAQARGRRARAGARAPAGRPASRSAG